MVVFKLKDFSKWASKVHLFDWNLSKAVEEMNRGLLGDRLGSHIYKKRIGISGRGKRGSVRTILCYKKDQRVVFLYGYSKNESDNIEEYELDALREFSKELISISNDEFDKKVASGKILKVQETN